MLTIFSAPKAFTGHVGIIQNNAITSWMRIKPQPRVILFGNEAGTAETACQLRVRHVNDVATNSFGTPLVSDMFRLADAMAAGDLLAFCSADIILTRSVIEAARIAASWAREFLLVAQRRDVDIREPIDLDQEADPRWKAITAKARLHSPGAVDLFVYRRGQYSNMPPFAIGRTSYDNWLLWQTLTSGLPLIDATVFATLFHQNHDYSHAPGVDVWYGEEAQANRKWVQHWSQYYSIVHANWKLGADGRIVRATDWKYRMARPRQLLSHMLRASRRIRTRWQLRRFAGRYDV